MNGFLLFDAVHNAWLVGIVIFLVASVIFYKRINKKQLFLLSIFAMLLLIEIWKQLYLYSSGRYSYYSPPLHLCGLGIFICGWHVFRPSRYSSTLLFSLTLPGAVIALLFPGWATDPVGSFLHIHSFIFHALLIAFVIPLLVTNELALKVKDLYASVLFLLITVPIIYWYNNRFSTNFMFLNKPVKNTPLQWLYDSFGASGYLLSLCGVLFLVWVMQYSIYSIFFKITEKFK